MEKLANPAPLGLMGFGMTTVLLNIHNAGFFPLNAMILGMGLFYGGIAQFVAGTMEYRRGNTFAGTAFCSYGAFWLTLVFLLLAPKWGWADKTPEGFMGWYLCMWGVFTFFMALGTLKANRALQTVFFSLTLLFVLLAARDWLAESNKDLSTLIGTVAGWEGIGCGLSAIYLAMAEILNEQFKRTVLPIGVLPVAVVALSTACANTACNPGCAGL
jgi:succinate-acetate transporter protein